MDPSPESAPEPAPEPALESGDDTSGAALVAKILGEKAEFSAAEVAAETGITFEEVRRLWRALGFPEADGARMYTRADIDAVSLLVSAVDGGLLDFDLAVTLTRALGQTMARLADWEASAMVHPIEEMLTGDATSRRVSRPRS